MPCAQWRAGMRTQYPAQGAAAVKAALTPQEMRPKLCEQSIVELVQLEIAFNKDHQAQSLSQLCPVQRDAEERNLGEDANCNTLLRFH